MCGVFWHDLVRFVQAVEFLVELTIIALVVVDRLAGDFASAHVFLLHEDEEGLIECGGFGYVGVFTDGGFVHPVVAGE